LQSKDEVPPLNSLSPWGQVKWRLTMETTRTTPPRISSSRRHPARQLGRLLYLSGYPDTIAKATGGLTERQLRVP
jgi:hypothetical protein